MNIKVIDVRKLNEENGQYNEANLSWSADGVYLGYEVIDSQKRQILVKDLGDNYSNLLLKLQEGKRANF